ncbi:MAG: carboxylesterase/lipase family protein [Holophaga sp.]|nr:carboxylesterase/lipase family protein [Holophaga sp.]
MQAHGHFAHLPRTALFLAALLGGNPFCSLGAEALQTVARTTSYGPVLGVDDTASSGTFFWKGVPFAKPPTGALRWQAPVEPTPWKKPLMAKTFGNASAQNGRLYGPGLNNTYDATIGATLNQAVGSEDSLYLNIWRPASKEANLPVIFFLHGGSNITGYTADPIYDGAALARKANAVVVTANYRLGVLAWLNLPPLKVGTDPQGDSGNFGTLDQILALNFVQKNIAQFGGDPANVTAMGESAGATDLYALLTSPVVVAATPQLFHRAILMSGGLALPNELPPGSVPSMMPAAFSENLATKWLTGLLITDGLAADAAGAARYLATQTAAQVAAYLRAKPVGDLLKQALTFGTTSHIPDGTVVATSAIAAIKAGKYLKVPMILSNTRDEGKLFPAWLAMAPALGGKPGLIVDDATRFNLMAGFNPDRPDASMEKALINPVYLPADEQATGFNARLALVTKLVFLANRDAMINALAANQSKIWCCQFAWDQEPAPWNTVYGAAHSFELPFVFGNFGPSLYANVIGGKANQGGRLALSEAMMQAFGAFARKADPNHAALGTPWPVWPKSLVFDATLTEKKISVP